ncbi:hypothetical protein H4W33_006442 [Kibdelosporangium phytohabitans]|nr:hypothetical protein [Kibdelosporangium phytohabitans]MBE1467430.1 hypothetical protein [Kibdelosporangium phytohabitans]
MLTIVKQADLSVGSEYAFQTYKPYDAAPVAARVRVISIDGRGKVTVKVSDPGAKVPKDRWGARSVKRNERLQVTTRDIICPWEEWADRAASIGSELAARAAAQRSNWSEHERRRADRVVVDANRMLPDEYDEQHFYEDTDAEERAVLADEYIRTRGLGSFATADKVRPLLVDLPVPVLRDILAADAYQRSGAPGTVAAVFTRAARLLETARITSRDVPLPHQLFGEADAAYVNAIRDDVAASGGQLLLPPVPSLPTWVDEEEQAMAPTLGWIRLVIGDTSGQRLHSPGCNTVRSRPAVSAEHAPWWQIMLESPHRLCGVCGGPGARDLLPIAGFVAAVDVWDSRGRDRIERWQQAAFQRLLSATAIARTQVPEPDITLAWRIVSALTENAPAEDGWAAYRLTAATDWNRLEKELEKLTPSQLEAARVLARDRMATLVATLPPSQRPLPLPQSVGVTKLRERYAHLRELLEETVPQLDRLLFTLPGAY